MNQPEAVRKKFKQFVPYAGLLVLVFLTGLVWSGEARSQEEEGLAIGVILPLSGANSVYGRIQKNSMVLAVEKVNSEGGINGRPLVLDIRNSGSRGPTAKSIAASFVEKKGYALIVGGFSSSTTKSIAAYSEKMVVPYLAITGSSDAITRNGYHYVFRLNPPLSRYGSGLVDLISEVVAPARVAVVYEKNTFGWGGASGVLKAAAVSGWDVVVNYGYQTGRLGLEPLLEAVSEGDPDVLYLSGYSKDAARILSALAGKNIPAGLVAGSSELGKDSFASSSGLYGKNALVSAIWAPGLNYQGTAQYVSDYLERFGNLPDYHGAEAYASIQVAADALRRVPFVEPAAVTRALASTEIETVFGPVSFVEKEGFNNQNLPPTYVLQWQNGTRTIVWPPEFAESELILSREQTGRKTQRAGYRD